MSIGMVWSGSSRRALSVARRFSQQPGWSRAVTPSITRAWRRYRIPCLLAQSRRSLTTLRDPLGTACLSAPLLIYAPASPSYPRQSKRGSSGASKPTSLGMIALGTDKGSVSVWDLKRGALAYSLGEVSRPAAFRLVALPSLLPKASTHVYPQSVRRVRPAAQVATRFKPPRRSTENRWRQREYCIICWCVGRPQTSLLSLFCLFSSRVPAVSLAPNRRARAFRA